MVYLYSTEPIVLHRTTRRVQEVNNKELTIVGSTTAVHKTKSVWKQWSVLDNKDNKNIGKQRKGKYNEVVLRGRVIVYVQEILYR